jgi:REP element-mobilizing transposase RayT
MAVKFKHDDTYSMYFCTFTCFDWLPLIDITNSYDIVYNWFNYLKSKEVFVIAYVIMPNHLHCILHFPSPNFNLNKVIGNGKRFMAYEIIKRLHNKEETLLIQSLSNAVTPRERKKGQLHKVFKSSFDAKPIFSDKFLMQKINYIHHNPVSGKWNLAKDFVSYEYSSASFYELGIGQHFVPLHYTDL